MSFNNPATPIYPHHVVTVIPESTAPFGGDIIRLHITPTGEDDTNVIQAEQATWLEGVLSDLETTLEGTADIADVQVRKYTENVTVV